MTLREAEKAVLEAADTWERMTTPSTVRENADALSLAVRLWRRTRAAGTPRAKCYCGRTVSIEGDHLRHHRRGDDGTEEHAPTLDDVLQNGGKLL